MPTLPSGFQITLNAYDQELVAVEVGAGLRSYAVDGRQVIDGYAPDEMCADGRGQILAPWPNRLAGGSYEWDGKHYDTPLSEASRRNAIHGLVRWSAWAVRSASADRVVLTHRLHPQAGWPWRLDFLVEYRLGPAGLVVRTEVTNDSRGPAPFGLGWHPYLKALAASVDDAELTLPASTAYQTDGCGIPVGTIPVAGTEFDFSRGRRIGEAKLDTCFTGLERGSDGRARARLASTGDGIYRATELWVDDSYTHLMVFTGDTLAPDRRRRGLALEPMTCAPNALRSGDGLVTLAPGESFEATWGILTA